MSMILELPSAVKLTDWEQSHVTLRLPPWKKYKKLAGISKFFIFNIHTLFCRDCKFSGQGNRTCWDCLAFLFDLALHLKILKIISD